MRFLATLDKKRWITAAVAGTLAFLSGYLMQNVLDAAPAPRAAAVIVLPVAPVQASMVSLRPPPRLPDRIRETRAERTDACVTSLDVVESAPAMITVSLTAPCHNGKPVVISVNGIEAEVTTNERGRWTQRLPAFEPAMAVQAEVEGRVLKAEVELAAPARFQHVILAWSGPRAFRIRARAIGDGADQPGQQTLVGDTGGPAFEIFRSPDPGAGGTGVVRLSVDATVTKDNCGRPAAVTAYQTGFSGGLRPTEISYSMPDCSHVGRTVRLQNLFRDMTLALR